MSPEPGQVKAASRGNKASKDPVAINPGAIKEAKLNEYLVRFVFGAVVSAVAGLVGLRFGPRVGGLFLAFPAILPAALSLIETKDGEGPADADVQGGVLGAVGMVVFALVVLLATRSWGAGALVVALLAWGLVAGGLYLLMRRTWPHVWA